MADMVLHDTRGSNNEAVKDKPKKKKEMSPYQKCYQKKLAQGIDKGKASVQCSLETMDESGVGE